VALKPFYRRGITPEKRSIAIVSSIAKYRRKAPLVCPLRSRVSKLRTDQCKVVPETFTCFTVAIEISMKDSRGGELQAAKTCDHKPITYHAILPAMILLRLAIVCGKVIFRIQSWSAGGSPRFPRTSHDSVGPWLGSLIRVEFISYTSKDV
jgi:hypothetical protein